MASIASLTIDIAASVARLEQSMNQANGIVQKGFGRMERLAGGVRNAFAAIGIGLSVGGLTAWVKSGIDAADQMNEVSKRVGMSVADLSTLKFAAEQSGGSFDALTSGLAKFEVNLAKAGIPGTEMTGMLKAIADRMAATEDPAKRMQIAVSAFGKSAGPELVEFLSQGGRAIGDLQAQARAAGLEMSGQTAQAADDFNDRLNALKSQAQAAAVIIGGSFVSALGDLSTNGFSPELFNSLKTFGTLLGKTSEFILDHIGVLGRLTTAYAGLKLGAAAGAALGPYGATGLGAAGFLTGYMAPELIGAGKGDEIKVIEDKLARLQERATVLRDRITKGTAEVSFLPFDFKISDRDLARSKANLDEVETQIREITETRNKLIASTTTQTTDFVGPLLPTNTALDKYDEYVAKLVDKMDKGTKTIKGKAKDQFDALFESASKRYAIPSGLLKAIADVETGGSFKTNLTSPAGAVGLMQLMPKTAERFGVKDRTNASQAIEGAARYVAELLKQFGGDLVKTIAAYNAGEGRVGKAIVGGELQIAKLPKETQDYIPKVAGKLEDYGEFKLNVEQIARAQEALAELQRQALETKASLLDMTGDRIGAGVIQINLKYDELIQKLEEVGDSAGTALAKQAKAVELAQNRISGTLQNYGAAYGYKEAQIRLHASEDQNAPVFGRFDAGAAYSKLTRSEREQVDLLKEKRTVLEELARTQNLDQKTYLDLQTQIVETQTQINESLRGKMDEMTEFTRQAARNMQDAMGEFFFDVLQGKMDNFVDRFKRMIDQMVAQWLAAQISNGLFGKNFLEGGSIGGVLGSLFGTGSQPPAAGATAPAVTAALSSAPALTAALSPAALPATVTLSSASAPALALPAPQRASSVGPNLFQTLSSTLGGDGGQLCRCYPVTTSTLNGGDVSSFIDLSRATAVHSGIANTVETAADRWFQAVPAIQPGIAFDLGELSRIRPSDWSQASAGSVPALGGIGIGAITGFGSFGEATAPGQGQAATALDVVRTVTEAQVNQIGSTRIWTDLLQQSSETVGGFSTSLDQGIESVGQMATGMSGIITTLQNQIGAPAGGGIDFGGVIQSILGGSPAAAATAASPTINLAVDQLITGSGLFARGAVFQSGQPLRRFALGGIVDRRSMPGPHYRFALGGIVDRFTGIEDRITRRFATGDIVSSPTTFPMLSGTGLMGEAGPEAIMPVKRMADGRLGVKAETGGAKGGSQTVVVNFHLPNVRDATEFKRSVSQNAQAASGMLARAARRNG